MEIDRENRNTKWRDAELYEIGCIDEHNVFDDKRKGYKPGPDYKKILVHMVCAVKHDGTHRARLVAGHLMDTPIDSVYSSMVSLWGIGILAFLAELNKLELWATDIRSAYLESYTKEKVYIVAGPEFGERRGHTLIFVRASYGIKSSGLRWHKWPSDVLLDMGLFPSKAEPEIWMREVDDHYGIGLCWWLNDHQQEPKCHSGHPRDRLQIQVERQWASLDSSRLQLVLRWGREFLLCFQEIHHQDDCYGWETLWTKTQTSGIATV